VRMNRLFAVANEDSVIRLRDDIVVHLREHQQYSVLHGIAADEIERLRAELDECRTPQRIRAAKAAWEDILNEVQDD